MYIAQSCVQVSLEWVSVEVDQFGTNQQTHIMVLEIKWHWDSPSNAITTRGAQNSSRPTPASFHYVIMKRCSIGSPRPGSCAMGLESRVGIILGWFDNVDWHVTLTPFSSLTQLENLTWNCLTRFSTSHHSPIKKYYRPNSRPLTNKQQSSYCIILV